MDEDSNDTILVDGMDKRKCISPICSLDIKHRKLWQKPITLYSALVKGKCKLLMYFELVSGSLNTGLIELERKMTRSGFRTGKSE
ncbi:beta-glucosidase [Sesbania bispinosa]|nr:beta-glucosidase [Sesbania bispinosa]